MGTLETYNYDIKKQKTSNILSDCTIDKNQQFKLNKTRSIINKLERKHILSQQSTVKALGHCLKNLTNDNNAEVATQIMLNLKKVSCKINYNVLSNLLSCI